MKNQVLADRVRHFKQEEEGISTMCDSMNELRMQSEARGEARMQRNMAESMLKKGKYGLEEIAELTALPIEEVRMIEAQYSA